MNRMRILPFLLLSAILHAAVLLMAPGWQDGPPRTALRVTLTAASAPTVPLQEVPAAPSEVEPPRNGHSTNPGEPPVKSAPGPLPAPPAAQESRSAPETVTWAYDESEPIHSTRAPPPLHQPGEEILSQVRQAMSRYFSYPLLARQQGWEGEVLLGFSVFPDGRIDDVRIVQSSGHRLLDEAACSALARVGALPDARPQERLQLHLPVTYRLTEG